jgi:hypothetical protein
VLLLHRTLPTEAVLAGIDAAVGGGAPSSSGPESSERVWGTLAQVSLHPRQFRVTGHAPRAACPSRSVDEHPRGEASFADRAWSSRGRPATGSGVWCSGLSWGLRLRVPPSWVSGVGSTPPRAAITNSWPPAGYLRFPGPDQTVIVGPYQVDRTRGRRQFPSAPCFTVSGRSWIERFSRRIPELAAQSRSRRRC